MNKADEVFLRDMLAHHQEALVMAKKVLERGEDAKVKALASSILKTQTAEIATMKALGGKASSSSMREHASVLELRDRLMKGST